MYKSSQPITDQLGGVKAGSPQTLRCLLVAQFYVNEAKTEKINTVTVNTHNKHSKNDPESDPFTGGGTLIHWWCADPAWKLSLIDISSYPWITTARVTLAVMTSVCCKYREIISLVLADLQLWHRLASTDPICSSACDYCRSRPITGCAERHVTERRRTTGNAAEQRKRSRCAGNLNLRECLVLCVYKCLHHLDAWRVIQQMLVCSPRVWSSSSSSSSDMSTKSLAK